MKMEQDYVLGTNDEEVSRLGLQHRAWLPCTSAAWHDAGICAGQTGLEIGCGPGYATLDLAELVGSSGRVVAVDKSDRFLSTLDRERCRRGLDNIVTHNVDFDGGELPPVTADAAWCRWGSLSCANRAPSSRGC